MIWGNLKWLEKTWGDLTYYDVIWVNICNLRCVKKLKSRNKGFYVFFVKYFTFDFFVKGFFAQTFLFNLLFLWPLFFYNQTFPFWRYIFPNNTDRNKKKKIGQEKAFTLLSKFIFNGFMSFRRKNEIAKRKEPRYPSYQNVVIGTRLPSGTEMIFFSKQDWK